MKNILKKSIAEFIGTFALVFMGTSSIFVCPPSVVPLVFGLIIMVMIYSVGHISGAHFNPAVTLGFFVVRRFPLKELMWYWGAQILGAILGSFLVKLLFFSDAAASIGVTLPSIVISKAFILESILTFILMFTIISVATDYRAQGHMAGLSIGGAVCLGAFIGGPLTGGSMNPARSFAPALMYSQWDFHWLYWIAPMVGAALAALSYEFIRCETQKDEDKKNAKGCC